MLPCEDTYLRRKTQDRFSYRVARYDFLRYPLEYDLTRLLVQEINTMRRVEINRDSLMRRYDFSVYNAFRSVDRYNDGFIDSINLGSFLR